jgi:hypothetical protein
MKVLSWNCQGLGNPKTVRALQKLIATNHPDLIFIMETQLHTISNKFKAKFAASYNLYDIDCVLNGDRGRARSILFLWNHCTCHVEIKDMNFKYIDVIVINNKHLTCELIQSIANNSNNNNWLMYGDFNLILSSN